eukprot:SM004559S16328  [mRNA]  locus=s4559:150:1124:+ [translate_table: standard]
MHCRCRRELHFQWPRSSPTLCQGHGAHARARPPPRPPGADAERARAAPRAHHAREPGAPAAARLGQRAGRVLHLAGHGRALCHVHGPPRRYCTHPRSCLARLPPPCLLLSALPPFHPRSSDPPSSSSSHLPPTSSFPTPNQNHRAPFLVDLQPLEVVVWADRLCFKWDRWPAPHRRRELRLAFVVKGEVEFRSGDLVRTLQ